MAVHQEYDNGRSVGHAERISALEVQMLALMGNGQPGKIAGIEKKLDSIQKFLWIGIGALAVLNFLQSSGVISLKSILGH